MRRWIERTIKPIWYVMITRSPEFSPPEASDITARERMKWRKERRKHTVRTAFSSVGRHLRRRAVPDLGTIGCTQRPRPKLLCHISQQTKRRNLWMSKRDVDGQSLVHRTPSTVYLVRTHLAFHGSHCRHRSSTWYRSPDVASATTYPMRQMHCYNGIRPRSMVECCQRAGKRALEGVPRKATCVAGPHGMHTHYPARHSDHFTSPSYLETVQWSSCRDHRLPKPHLDRVRV